MTPWYTSKQFWFNVLTALVIVAAAFGFESFTPDARTVVIAQLVVAVINVVLRFAVPSQPPTARVELAKNGAWDPQAPTGAYRRANITAAATFAVTTISIAAAILLAQ